MPPRQDDLLLRLVKDINDIRSALRRVVANLPLYDISNENTPAQITADQNNYVPGNFDVLRLSTDAARSITGLAGGVKGRYLRLLNVGSFSITLKHQSASSLIANRFKFATGSNHVILPSSNILLYYDATQGYWIEGLQLEDSGISKEYSAPQITANQNNYSSSDYSVLRLNSDAERTITGIDGGVQGRFLRIFNVGSYALILSYEDAASSAANRFKFSNGISAFIAPGANMTLYYDITQTRWVGGSDRGALAIMDDQQVDFNPGQTFAAGWADVTGATVTLVTKVRCTIEVDAFVTGYNTFNGAGRSFYYRSVVGGVADPDVGQGYIGSQSPPINDTLAYRHRVTGVAAGSIVVKLQCQADSGINEPNYITEGRMLVRALAEG